MTDLVLEKHNDCTKKSASWVALPPVMDSWQKGSWNYVAFHMLKMGFDWFDFSFGLTAALPAEIIEPIFRASEHVLADFTESHGLQVYTPPMILWLNVGNHSMISIIIKSKC